MRFALTDDQTALREAVRDVLTRADGTALADLGVPGMMVPERAGGLGLSEVDLIPVLIEVGYAAVPLPVAETAAVAAPLLGSVPRNWIAVRRTDGLVPWAGCASAVLDLTGSVATLRPTRGTDVSTVDGSRAARLLDDAPGEVVTDDPVQVALALDRADLATAAQLIGLGRRMLDLTVGHVKTRTQFGVPVGSFQAVKHHLADALLRVEFAEPLVYAAAWALATGSADRKDLSAAVVLAVDAARFVARQAIQCHGAIGYTVEYDLHRYAKRTWALAATCDLDAHLARLAAALELEAP